MGTMKVRGIRGATTATANTKEAIYEATGEMLQKLVESNGIDPDDIAAATFSTTRDLNAALLQFRELDLLEVSSLSDPKAASSDIIDPAIAEADRPRVRIVHGIEDRPYFHWQLAIMFESLNGPVSRWCVRLS